MRLKAFVFRSKAGGRRRDDRARLTSGALSSSRLTPLAGPVAITCAPLVTRTAERPPTLPRSLYGLLRRGYAGYGGHQDRRTPWWRLRRGMPRCAGCDRRGFVGAECRSGGHRRAGGGVEDPSGRAGREVPYRGFRRLADRIR